LNISSLLIGNKIPDEETLAFTLNKFIMALS
jgi:hypothetical protein